MSASEAANRAAIEKAMGRFIKQKYDRDLTGPQFREANETEKLMAKAAPAPKREPRELTNEEVTSAFDRVEKQRLFRQNCELADRFGIQRPQWQRPEPSTASERPTISEKQLAEFVRQGVEAYIKDTAGSMKPHMMSEDDESGASRRYVLSSDTPAAEAVGAETVEGGEPIQKFRKRVLKVGNYVKRHPVTKKVLWKLNVDRARLDGLVKTFQAMKQGGVGVLLMDDTGKFTLPAPHAPITTDHEGAFEKSNSKRLKRLAAAVVAPTVDMFIDGEWLTTITEAKGRRAIDFIAASPFTSPEIEPCYIDGTDKSYGEAITAVSIVAKPLVPGQTGFERIAASE